MDQCIFGVFRRTPAVSFPAAGTEKTGYRSDFDLRLSTAFPQAQRLPRHRSTAMTSSDTTTNPTSTISALTNTCE